ncbi:MAG: SRPBCC family protein [Deltaproteobacteria bacterium]|nr:SRPBCC family protein [Deltaproteobacteria bacterium]
MKFLFPRRILLLLTGTMFVFLLQGCASRYTVQPTPRYASIQGEFNRHSRVVRAGKERIFRMLTHGELFGALCPKGTIVTFLTPGPYGVGTLIHTRIEHLFHLEWHSRVEEVVPEERIRLRFLDGFFAGGVEIWELEPAGDGTRVTQTIIVEPRGLLRKAAWLLKVRNRHDVMVEKFLDRLKEYAENPLLHTRVDAP